MRSAAIAGLFLLFCAGCGSSESKEPVRYVSDSLTLMDGCQQVEQALREAAIQEMEMQLDQLRDAVLNFDDSQCNSLAMEDMATGMSPPSAQNNSGTGASQYSTTNNQVPGVDEADLVKNNNRYIYVASGSSFKVVEAWPAAQARAIAKVPIEGRAKRLFVEGDRALVYSSLGPPEVLDANGKSTECTYGYSCQFIGDGRATKITVLDISDPTKPQLLREIRLSGSYIAARRIGTTVHTVLSSAGPVFPHLETTLPGVNACDSRPPTWQLLADIEDMRARNRRTIAAAVVAGWAPSAVDTLYSDGAVQSSRDLLSSCQGFYRSGLNDGTALLTVLSLDLKESSAVSASTIVSRSGAAYATAESLYIAVPHSYNPFAGWMRSVEGVSEASTIHKFTLNNSPPEVAYVGSGSVKGRVLNQFSMDESEGYVRIATTTGSWGGGLHNTVSVLQQTGKTLSQVGMLDHIAQGEDIRSVRFDGPRGFLVTFKKTDPLYFLDLSDPKQPKVLGELQIPGFSTYMHMLDSNHLLTIGYDGNDQGTFAWFSAVSLQIFDVSSPTNLKRLHKESIGTRGSASEALTNHLAFNYYAPLKLLALPMMVCEGGNAGSYGTNLSFSGLMVYNTTVEDGFSLLGKVPHHNDGTGKGYENAACHTFWTYSSSEVKRSIFMDNFVYSVSENLLKVSSLSDMTESVATVSLQ